MSGTLYYVLIMHTVYTQSYYTLFIKNRNKNIYTLVVHEKDSGQSAKFDVGERYI